MCWLRVFHKILGENNLVENKCGNVSDLIITLEDIKTEMV